MSKMNDYATEAQRAHDSLLPMLEAAIQDATERQEQASQKANADTIRPQLVAMIDGADTPAPDAIGGIIATYAALLNNPGTRDGKWLIESLHSTVKHHGLKPAQAGQIAGAIVGAIQGKAPLSLIEWPAADDWHKYLHHADLLQWAAWIAPKKYEEFAAALDATAEERIRADTDLAQLEQARKALADLVPEFRESNVVRIRNNGEHGQGVAGIRWKAGEIVEVAANDYARLVAATGYQHLNESGQLEVVA